jgi:hypothetical protein
LIALFQKALKNANDEILEDRMPNHSKVHTAAQHTHHTHHIKISAVALRLPATKQLIVTEDSPHCLVKIINLPIAIHHPFDYHHFIITIHHHHNSSSS